MTYAHLAPQEINVLRSADLARILEKMRMKTNAELTRYVVENKLTP